MSPETQRFQAALLLSLAEDRPTVPAVAPHADSEIAAWVASWDPRMLDLAGVLVRTWAYREPPR